MIKMQRSRQLCLQQPGDCEVRDPEGNGEDQQQNYKPGLKKARSWPLRFLWKLPWRVEVSRRAGWSSRQLHQSTGMFHSRVQEVGQAWQQTAKSKHGASDWAESQEGGMEETKAGRGFVGGVQPMHEETE